MNLFSRRAPVPVSAFLFALLLASGLRAGAPVRVLSDIAYQGDGADTAYARERCKLDLYLPEGVTEFPSIVWFHGGNLEGGDKSGEMTVAIARRFAGDGIAVATVNYRLHPQVSFPTYIEDAAASVAWLVRNISEHGGDPAKVFVSGHSAGGYLTAMVGLDPRYLREHELDATNLAGLIPVSGQMVTHSTVRRERGIARTTPVIDAGAPSYYVREGLPPIFSICGSEDLPARAAENIYFIAALHAAGDEDAKYVEFAGRDHGSIVSRIPEKEDPVALAIEEFVRVHAAAPKDTGVTAASDRRGELPGHRILLADSSERRIAIVSPTGETEWEHEIGDLHDLAVLPNGNILFQTDWTTIVEVDPKTNETVWKYDSAGDRKSGRVEVHAFERLPNGLTMIAESGRGRIIEVDRDGTIVREVPLSLERRDPHRDTRLVRKLANGHYLVCHEGLGRVREYDPSGTVVWDYEVPLFGREPRGGHGPEAYGNAAFAALRLESGNTLISTGNGHGVIEVTPEKEIVWSIGQRDLPGIVLAWVTTLEVLPNGHIVLGNCHAGPENPQIVEIDREKHVVWTFHDFERFGNATTSSQILDAGGRGLR